jgi:integrase
MQKRGMRAGVEDRWHRAPREGEQPTPQGDGPQQPAGVWCMDPRHGDPGTQITTTRHGKGQRWYARWVDRDGKERGKTFERKAAATFVTQVSSDMVIGTYVDKSSAVPFGIVADEWIAAKAPTVKPSTATSYRSLLNTVVLPRWRDISLVDMTHEDIQTWVTWMTTDREARHARSLIKAKNDARKPLSARRAVHAYGIVSQVLACAIRTKRLAVNPSDDIELPRIVNREETALSLDQVNALVAAADEAAPIIQTLAFVGLRFGELVALRVKDVDLSKRRILVTKAFALVGNDLVEGTTKTHQGRSVPILTDALADTLRSVTQGRSPDDYLFPGPDGEPLRNDYLSWRFAKAAESAGLAGITIKTLRHTAGSLALQAGASVVTVQKLLGHRNATTTMNVYSHMLPDDFDNLAAKMDAAARAAVKA